MESVIIRIIGEFILGVIRGATFAMMLVALAWPIVVVIGKLKIWHRRRKRDRKIEIIKRNAENHGLKIEKIKIDGYNVQIILCDETPPREGGHSNEK
jgi:uncharacterized Tic20 family protein